MKQIESIVNDGTGAWGEGIDPRVVLSDTRIFDVLLQNSDRHAGHFLFGRHWTL